MVSITSGLHKKYNNMEKNREISMSKDEVLKRYQLSKQKKQQRLKELENGLRADFKKITGIDAKSFVVW